MFEGRGPDKRDCMLIDIHIFIMSCSIFIVFGSTPN